MRQTLLYLPTQIAGVPIFGMGILFWIILLAGLFAIVKCLIQRKNVGDVPFYALITALGLVVVRFVGPGLAEHDGFPIRGYGVFLTLAIALSGLVVIWRGKKLWNYPADTLFSALFISAIFGLVGARCFYVAQYWQDYQCGNLRDTILSAINIANGGLVVYGSIIGGIVSAVVYLYVKRIPILPTLDLAIPALMLGIAVGRIGCLMNGCCFGSPCDLPWAITFPAGSPAYMQQLDEGVISLYGITLAPPTSDAESAESEKDKEIFSLKSKHVHLASETPSSIVVASVDSGSAAEEAGIKSGDRICEMGIVPKGFLSSDDSMRDAFEKRKITRFTATNNAQVFYFFLNIWGGDAENDVWLVVQSPEENDANAGEAGASHELTRMRNVVFHPAPSKARPVHPTQVYSSVNAFVIFCLLLFLSKFVKRDGGLFGLGALLYAINRFCLELIRTDEESFHGTGLTVSQCVSLCIAVGAIALLVWVYVNPPKYKLKGFFPVEKSEDASDNPAQPS